ncbi:hypothetical protein ACFFV7_25940 [Nonomuraea spiralis]|uniref:Secreted protein n=1 Tax=Nonomuraea spiralis TaxID=46182 RepID=A0ABV5IJF0_9ACTN|nr:hypothetical protein [Nonomuraea spiralis]GGT42073.1 hypothetical protein GCM10010176_102060 [Nonomuraea spiralis]
MYARGALATTAVIVAGALTLLGRPAQAGPNPHHQAAADGPCRAEQTHRVGGTVIKYEQFGARSVCPAGTYQHWHQVHIRCGIEPERPGPMVGGTSVSEEWCPKNTLLQDYWVTQGPQEG